VHTTLRRLVVGTSGALLLAAALPAPPALAQELPRSRLAVHTGTGWRTWWRSDRAPERWRAPLPAVARAVAWRPAQPGVEWGELRLAGRGEAWRLRVVLVRVDPARVRLELVDSTRAGGTLGGWSLDAAPDAALVALNAGQFSGGIPWGWVVRDGREVKPPGQGPLSMAIVKEASGAVRLVPADRIEAVRESGTVVQAFQSYPALLVGDGRVPEPLRAWGRGVDVGHRDSRVAVGELRDGRLLIAVTRFEGLRGVLSELPFGPTTPEMAALMGALGARQAVMLDGGISGQLLLRSADGETRTWRGMRRVPLGLLLWPRE
jgi:hypothetical protein